MAGKTGRGKTETNAVMPADDAALTDAELAEMIPATEFFPPASMARLEKARGRPKLARPKVLVSLRLDAAALDAWKASGRGWQSRIGALVAREAPKAKRRV